MKNTVNNDTEQQIITAAKQVFIEKGFEETSMSDIAARAGINRPGLHYYFRTKEKMFEAVFADLIDSFVPAIHKTLLQDKPILERVAEMIDIYFALFRKEPRFSMFMLREVQRDAPHLMETLRKLEIGQYASSIKKVLQEEMSRKELRQVPVEFIFYTFYGLVIFPFLSKPLADILFEDTETGFDEKLCRWKAHVIRQMECLLCPAGK